MRASEVVINSVPQESYSQLRTEPDKLIQLVVERDRALAEREREIAKLQNIIRLANQRTYGLSVSALN